MSDEKIKLNAKKKLKKLCQKFENDIRTYKNPNYNERSVRGEFIDQFFICLGWDVNNESSKIDRFKDVIQEYSIEAKDEHRKNPDYAFTIGGGQKVFFVEAKKPFENINNNKKHAYQLRKYAWNSEMQISILMDFEEMSIYDCTIKPNKNDEARIGRIAHYKFTEYISKFDELWDSLSKNNILKGGIERFVKNKINAKGTNKVDFVFLEEMEHWREILARNIAKENKNKISTFELNRCVQKILDSILFLRICEDRSIEDYKHLEMITKKSGIHKQLCDYYDEADKKYNSGLFDPNQNILVKNIIIDDKILREIITDLYPPKSSYDFSIMSVEILGKVYEKFLGKTIRLTKSGQIKIEMKPDVKIAGGIYYTPEFVVKYIVDKTVGEIIKGKTPQEIEKIRIFDPACGSGTFLVKSYECLLDYHLEYYLKNQKNEENVLYQLDENKWALTTDVRKKILLNNIFGMDIDAYAVENTKLSLLLRVLENETRQSINYQRKLFREKALPNLAENIICGNTIVDTSIYDNREYSKNLTGEDIIKIKPFDWNDVSTKLGKIIANGFDVIIGNPPYVKEDVNKQIFHDVRATNLKKYHQGKMDYWYFFTHKALDNLRNDGYHSFITQNTWLTSDGAKILRKNIFSKSMLKIYCDFNEYMVFDNATIQTSVFVCIKRKPISNYSCMCSKINLKNISIEEVRSSLLCNTTSDKIKKYEVTIDPLEYEHINFYEKNIVNVLTKIKNNSNCKLQDDEIESGMDTLQEYVVENHLKKLKNPSIQKNDGIFILSNDEKTKMKFNKNELKKIKPFYTTNELGKYCAKKKNQKWVIYSDKIVRENIEQYPNFKKHLDKFSMVMTSDSRPYGLNRPRNENIFNSEKLVALRMTKEPKFTYSDFSCFVSRTFIIIKSDILNIKYLAALFNSKLSYFIFYHMGKKKGNQLQIDKTPLKNFPIRIPKPNEKEMESDIIMNFESILHEYKNIENVRTSEEKSIISAHINSIQNKIDAILYQLYDLTKEDIEIINNSLKFS